MRDERSALEGIATTRIGTITILTDAHERDEGVGGEGDIEHLIMRGVHHLPPISTIGGEVELGLDRLRPVLGEERSTFLAICKAIASDNGAVCWAESKALEDDRLPALGAQVGVQHTRGKSRTRSSKTGGGAHHYDTGAGLGNDALGGLEARRDARSDLANDGCWDR